MSGSMTDKRLTFSVKQSGAALLLLLTIVVLSISAFLLSGTSRVQHILDGKNHNSKVLSLAKNALISYARLSDPDLSAATGLNFRYLPCPDLDGDGIEETPCGSTSAEGWLPWMSLGLSPLRDASASCLRYFVSSSYKQGASVAPLIAALPVADFTLRNTTQIISSDVVAVLVAPGDVLLGQTRAVSSGSSTECGSSILSSAKNQAANYMDSLAGVNNAVPANFITAPEQANFNDTLFVILRSEL